MKSCALLAGVLLTLGAALAQSPPAGDGNVTAGPRAFVGRVLSLCFGEGSLWLSSHTDGPIWNHQEGKVYRIDPHTLKVVATFPVSGEVAVGEGPSESATAPRPSAPEPCRRTTAN